MLKTHVIALLLVYFPALFDHSVEHDHHHVETVEIISDKHRIR